MIDVAESLMTIPELLLIIPYS